MNNDRLSLAFFCLLLVLIGGASGIGLASYEYNLVLAKYDLASKNPTRNIERFAHYSLEINGRECKNPVSLTSDLIDEIKRCEDATMKASMLSESGCWKE